MEKDKLIKEFVEVANKTVDWLERLSKRSGEMEKENRGRFDSLADACKHDLKNYRAVIKDFRNVLAKVKDDGGAG